MIHVIAPSRISLEVIKLSDPLSLEVVSRYPSKGKRCTPLLFVHGAFSAAWIWSEHFLDWFSERGWPVHAVSLRGHGGSEVMNRLDSGVLITTSLMSCRLLKRLLNGLCSLGTQWGFCCTEMLRAIDLSSSCAHVFRAAKWLDGEHHFDGVVTTGFDGQPGSINDGGSGRR